MKRNTAILILFIVIIIGVLAGLKLSGSGEQESVQASETTTTSEARVLYTLPLAPGSKLTINSTVAFRGENATVNSSLTYIFDVSGVEWPLVLGNYTIKGESNRTSIAAMVFANLALPQELLGREKVRVPLTIPFAGDSLCIELSLESGGGNYTYRGAADLSAVRVDVILIYDTRGLLVYGFFNISVEVGGRESGFSLEQKLVNASVTGTLRMEAERGWICNPPFSSNIMFVWDGLYMLTPDGLVPVDARDIRAAVLEGGVVAVIYKDGRNLTNEFWRNLYRAVRETGENVYVIIVGGLASRDVQIMAGDVLGRASAVEGNVAIRFENGRATMKVYSFGTYEDLVNLLAGSR